MFWFYVLKCSKSTFQVEKICVCHAPHFCLSALSFTRISHFPWLFFVSPSISFCSFCSLTHLPGDCVAQGPLPFTFPGRALWFVDCEVLGCWKLPWCHALTLYCFAGVQDEVTYLGYLSGILVVYRHAKLTKWKFIV